MSSVPNSPRPFVHLHLHTQYSLLKGAVRLKQLFTHIEHQNMPAIAMTDHANMFGAIDFQLKAGKAGVHPIFGIELNFLPQFQQKHKPYHIVLLAKNEVGYKSLRMLASMSYLEGMINDVPHVDLAMLRTHNEGVIALSGGVNGIIERTLHEKGAKEAKDWVDTLLKIWGHDDFYLEVQPLQTTRQNEANQFFLQQFQQHQIQLVACNECYYMEQSEARAHKVLSCIALGIEERGYEDEYSICDQHWFKNGDDIARMLGANFEVAIQNTLKIAEQCQFKIPLGNIYLPAYEVPKEFNVETFLVHRSEQGLYERFTEFDSVDKTYDVQEYQDRLKMELDIIINMKFPGYFLIVQDFINWAKDHEIPVGPGRGSGAGSLVAYALRITDLDPIPYGLLFERFLNPERVSMPDFDIDFCMNRRVEVIEYVTHKYGTSNVGQIATFGALKAKGVIKDVGRVLGFGYNDTDRLSKMVPDVLNITLDEALKQEPRLAKFYDEDKEIRNLLDIAKSLEGLHRNTGMHAAGVVIGDEPLWHYCPVFKGSNGELVTQFAKDEVEMAGLVKFDFLGLKTLTVIQDAVDLVNQNYPDRDTLDVYKLPLTDRAVYDLISSGETEGVFQLESSGFQELLKKLKPDVFEDIVAAVALYRPGPLNSGMLDTFIDRKHGREEIIYPHDLLAEILQETYGVIVYQEQVMQIAQVMADFTLGAADLLRRAMGKKKMDVMAQQRTLFAEGASKKGVDQKKSNEIFDLMELFAQYGFNKSHSAAYALLTYHTAYLKAHHPAEFMAAVLTNDSDTPEKVAKGIRTAHRMGLKVLPPCINRSSSSFYGKGKEVLFGLNGIKGVGSAAVGSILDARKEGRFQSLGEFCERINHNRVGKRTLENLIQVGAFDFTQEPRLRLCTAIETLMSQAQKKQKDEASGQNTFFDMFQANVSEQEQDELAKWKDIGEWNPKQILHFEKSNLGFYVSGHPLDRFEKLIQKLQPVLCSEITQCDRYQQVRLIGHVEQIRVINAKSGGRLAFITFEDRTGSIEVVAKNDFLHHYESVLKSGEPLSILGEVKFSAHQDMPKVEIGHRGEDALNNAFVQTLSDLQGSKTHGIALNLYETTTPKPNFESLKKLLDREEFQGRCPLLVKLHLQNGTQLYLKTAYSFHPDESLAHEIKQIFEGSDVAFLDYKAMKNMKLIS